ncbi:MAG: hypothetical protein Q8M76_03965, partial [Spirochaetaceae bacterium]|nr:hypothetical protein [Spirochaetaceae bacterium]
RAGGAADGAAADADAGAENRHPEAARLLFSEDPGRFLVSVRPEDRERFEQSLSGSPLRLVGTTIAEKRMRATFRGKVVVDASLDALERAFKTPIA